MEGNLVEETARLPRRAATKAVASYSELTEGSGDESSFTPKGKIRSSNRGKRRSPLKPRSSVTLIGKPPATDFSPSVSAQVPITSARPTPRPLPKKPKQIVSPPTDTPTNAHDSDSDLTPVSSPIRSPNLNLKLLEHPPKTPQQVKKRRVVSTAASSPATLLWRPPPESWDVSKLGTYVWVLLDARARVLEPVNVADPGEQSKELLWWPGKVKSPLTSIPLKVRLFGDPHPGVKDVEIQAPSHINILSLEDSVGRARFESPEFISASALTEGVEGSPRKKQKHDRGSWEDRWRVAIGKLLHDKEDDPGSDAMPEVGTLGFAVYVSSGPQTKTSPTKGATATRKRNKNSASDAEDELDVDISDFKREEDRWSPPPADDSLDIPGELLLARETKNATVYWPARIIEYAPPESRTETGGYLLEFLDNTQKVIPRNFFFTSEEDGFTTCKIGQWESEVWDDAGNDDDDIVDAQRSTSPVPLDPPPSAQDFNQLDIRNQFVYTKNVLKALLNGQFVPAKRQHDLFIGGGPGRRSICEDAGLRGRMDPRDVVQLQKHVIEWCLRDEKQGKPIVDENQGVEPEGWSPSDDLTMANAFEDDLPVSNVRGGSPSPSVTDVTSMFSSHDLPLDSSCNASEDVELPPMSSQPSDGRMGSPTLSVAKSSQATKVNAGNPYLTQLDSALHTAYPRQRGCEAYEALSAVEKLDYCVNILLPEAILQILLWRNGYRTSAELLPEEEEKEIHEKGEELLQERDWVYDVMRLRTLKVQQMKKSQASLTRHAANGKTTKRGRPKRNVAMPKSYLE